MFNRWLLGTLFIASMAHADGPPLAVQTGPVQEVVAHRIHGEHYGCVDHLLGELPYLGDALGTDCTIERVEAINGRAFARAHTGSGEKNEDWYGWGKDVLSPCDCTVVRLLANDTINEPGLPGKPPAAGIMLKRADGVVFMLAHLGGMVVKQGDAVKAGSKLGVVSNNGFARAPHIHIGAFKDKTPLQIRFDPAT